jgi:23S rRNA-/tRNA-specific pseudouridylate synthase
VTAKLPEHSPLMTAFELSKVDWKKRIVYEDNDVVAVDKPSGMASAPAPAEEGTCRLHATRTRAKAAARLDLDVSVGWASPSSRGLWGGDALLLRTGR